MTLKDIQTKDLIDELVSRNGVEKVAVGPYQNYELRKKYSNDRKRIASNVVLIISNLVYVDNK